MKLYNNRPSPYGRKVLVVAHEKQLLDRIEVIQLDPWSDPPELVAATPLGKVPALITDDNTLTWIMHDGEGLRDGCSKKRAIHVANRHWNELRFGSALRHSRHERRYAASL